MSDAWKNLKRSTRARIGLARCGHALSTPEILALQMVNAKARRAVWQEWQCESLVIGLESVGDQTIQVESEVSTKEEFLKRPDLGRALSSQSYPALKSAGAQAHDVIFIVSDGLSAKAIDLHFLPLWKAIKPELQKCNLTYPALILAPYARVAISDAIGAQCRSKLAVIFIGERPGLSASDSLGIYLTYAPKLGNHDADRNCISNIHPPDGLSYADAAAKLLYLIKESLRLKISGVVLKENVEAHNLSANKSSLKIT